MASSAMGAPRSWTVKPHCTSSMAPRPLRWITALAELDPIAPMFRSSILLGRKAISLTIFSFASVPWPSHRRREPKFLRTGKLFTAKAAAQRLSGSPSTSLKHDRLCRKSRPPAFPGKSPGSS